MSQLAQNAFLILNASRANWIVSENTMVPVITLQHGQLDVMDDCIKMFFLKTPPSNQFLCRAYLCQAQLNAPTSSKNPVSMILN